MLVTLNPWTHVFKFAWVCLWLCIHSSLRKKTIFIEKSFFKEFWNLSAVNITDFTMDFGRRQTQKYTFKNPELEYLRRLGGLVINPEAFEEKYGKLLSLLKTSMTKGILSTLVQFYDPIYHCFTLPDYQLMPTMEEYSHLIEYPFLIRIHSRV